MSWNDEHCLRVIHRVISGARLEPNEVEDAVEYLAERTPPFLEGDVEFVRRLEDFDAYFDGFDMSVETAWHWRMREILAGEYQLSELPDHVREIAQELYYR
jgi:hypothetical protein